MKSEILNHFDRRNGRKPRAEQAQALLEIEAGWDSHDIIVVNAPTGCHGRGEQVLLVSGTPIAVEDVVCGQQLLGIDGSPRTVLERYTGTKPLYRIDTIDGDSMILTGDHLLHLYRTPEKAGKPASYTELAVQDWDKQTKWFKHLHKLHRPDKAFVYPKVALPIPPYILGLWLGDGSSHSASLTSMDQELVDAWVSFSKELGLLVRTQQLPDNKASTYHMHSSGEGNKMTLLLKDLEVWGNKHIPEIYLTASEEDRLELLAGLLDTDGHLHHNTYEITQKNTELASGIQLLARSLGFYCSKVECQKGCQTGVVGTYQRMLICGKHVGSIPVRLTRKKITDKKPQKGNVCGFTVTYLGEGEYFGFQVDKDHLYLDDDFYVTHNCGKTLLTDCIAQWQAAGGKRCHLVVPDNMLLAQAEVECAKEAAVMKAQRFYECTWKGLDDKPVKGTRATCPYKSCKKRFTDGCPYTRALKRWQKSNVRVSNRWMPGAHKMLDKCDVVIIDEGHSYADFLASLCAKRIWHKEMAFPLDAQTYVQIKNWCRQALEQLDHVDKGHPKIHLKQELQVLWQELSADVGKYTVTSTYAEYRGSPEPCIELRPLEVRDALPLAISRKVTKKMVFLSATYSVQDLKDLGLDRNRILFVTVGSPIPVDRRPIYVKPVLSNRVVDGYKDLNEVMEVLEVLARRFPNSKGIAHMTYSMSKEMRKRRIPEALKARLIFHDSEDKLSKLQEFYKSENAIFIGCGVSEGLDLKDDLARFGVVCKIPWGSLADPVTARKAEEDPDWYTWKAATSVMQACGRVCRSATDYGEMYILDSSYKRIPEKHWLGWFKEALHLL